MLGLDVAVARERLLVALLDGLEDRRRIELLVLVGALVLGEDAGAFGLRSRGELVRRDAERLLGEVREGDVTGDHHEAARDHPLHRGEVLAEPLGRRRPHAGEGVVHHLAGLELRRLRLGLDGGLATARQELLRALVLVLRELAGRVRLGGEALALAAALERLLATAGRAVRRGDGLFVLLRLGAFFAGDGLAVLDPESRRDAAGGALVGGVVVAFFALAVRVLRVVVARGLRLGGRVVGCALRL